MMRITDQGRSTSVASPAPAQRGFGSCRIVDLAMVPPEIEFSAVAVKMLLAHLVVNPVMATLNQREIKTQQC
jgi:hypothetical protein